MEIVVLQEIGKEAPAEFGPGDGQPYIKAVHVAPTEPAGSGIPADETLCGMPTGDMERLSHVPSDPGAWWPPDKEQWKCEGCDSALRTV